MAKYCPNCGNELNENAAMCVKCGTLVDNNQKYNQANNNTKKKGLPAWAVILIILGCIILVPIIIVIIIGIFGYNAIKKSGYESLDDYLENSNIFKDTEIGTIGDTLEANDIKITLQKASKNTSEKLEENKEYLVFFFEIENDSDETEYISNFDFDGYVDGYAIEPTDIYDDIDGVKNLSSNIAPSMKTIGYVAFEINSNWEKFEIHYDKAFEDEKIIFKVENEDNSNDA